MGLMLFVFFMKFRGRFERINSAMQTLHRKSQYCPTEYRLSFGPNLSGDSLRRCTGNYPTENVFLGIQETECTPGKQSLKNARSTISTVKR